MQVSRLLSLLAASALAALATAQQPKLLLDPANKPAGSTIFAQDALTTRLQARTIQEAERTLNAPFEGYSLVQGSLLTTSRDVLANVMNTSMAYRLTGDTRFSQYARTQMLTAATFADWYPGHFLGTAEMTLAMAIGYDWLGDALSEGDRATIRTAIVSKGLTPGLKEFTKRADWTRNGTNWSQVCGSSLAMAAIAVQDKEPAIAQRILSLAIPAVKRASNDYKEGGIPSEGPVYWRYGMAFHTMLNRTLVNNFGPKQSVLTDKAFATTAWYPVYVQGTSGKNFNFADSSDWFVPTPATLELARQTNQPAIAAWTNQRIAELLDDPQKWIEEHRLSALFLGWNSASADLNPDTLPLDRAFDGKQDIVTMRGSWTDPDASYVGIKGGQNGVPHGQLDLDSFVFDALGERWAMDLGKDSYNLPGYFSAQRSSYYRVSTAGQNTLNFGENQAKNASTAFKTGLNIPQPWASIDLTRAYTGARSIIRGFTFVNRTDLVVTDQVINSSKTWRWQMITPAAITLNGNQALLELNGKQLVAEILAPANAQFSIASTKPALAIENQNLGTQMLTVNMPTGSAQLQVRLSPVR